MSAGLGSIFKKNLILVVDYVIDNMVDHIVDHMVDHIVNHVEKKHI